MSGITSDYYTCKLYTEYGSFMEYYWDALACAEDDIEDEETRMVFRLLVKGMTIASKEYKG